MKIYEEQIEQRDWKSKPRYRFKRWKQINHPHDHVNEHCKSIYKHNCLKSFHLIKSHKATKFIVKKEVMEDEDVT